MEYITLPPKEKPRDPKIAAAVYVKLHAFTDQRLTKTSDNYRPRNNNDGLPFCHSDASFDDVVAEYNKIDALCQVERGDLDAQLTP